LEEATFYFAVVFIGSTPLPRQRERRASIYRHKGKERRRGGKVPLQYIFSGYIHVCLPGRGDVALFSIIMHSAGSFYQKEEQTSKLQLEMKSSDEIKQLEHTFSRG
jgi:hypothetical protein